MEHLHIIFYIRQITSKKHQVFADISGCRKILIGILYVCSKIEITISKIAWRVRLFLFKTDYRISIVVRDITTVR